MGIVCDKQYDNCNGIDATALTSLSLSHLISRLSIILSLKP